MRQTTNQQIFFKMFKSQNFWVTSYIQSVSESLRGEGPPFRQPIPQRFQIHQDFHRFAMFRLSPGCWNWIVVFDQAFHCTEQRRCSDMSDDLNSLYDPWSREFGEYVIVFQGFDLYVCFFFLVSSLSFSKENSLYQNPTALPRLLFTSVNLDHTSYVRVTEKFRRSVSTESTGSVRCALELLLQCPGLWYLSLSHNCLFQLAVFSDQMIQQALYQCELN